MTSRLDKLRASCRRVIAHEEALIATGGTPLHAELKITRACLALCDVAEALTDPDAPTRMTRSAARLSLIRLLEELGL
jgi:hypothetical protein